MWYNLGAMYVHLRNQSNCIQDRMVFAATRADLGGAQSAGGLVPYHLPEHVLSTCVPSRTIKWFDQQANAQIVSELTALYQQHTASPAGFSAALRTGLGYEPTISPGEEVRSGT
jgi:hypothetical protein